MKKESIVINKENEFITIIYKPPEFAETCEKNVNNKIDLLCEALANCFVDYKIQNGANELSTKINLFQKELHYKIKFIENSREANKAVRFH